MPRGTRTIGEGGEVNLSHVKKATLLPAIAVNELPAVFIFIDWRSTISILKEKYKVCEQLR